MNGAWLRVWAMVAVGAVAVGARGQASRPAGGGLEVETGKVVLHDKGRGKDLPVWIGYPRTGGGYPVIVFSHGAAGDGESYELMLSYWVAHGYVCLAPTHADSVALDKPGETIGQGLRNALTQAIHDPAAWENRVADCVRVMDWLDHAAANMPELKGKMDIKRIGMGGHSFGAFTSQLIGGATVDAGAGGKPKSFADPRPRAILQLSGQGIGQMGLSEHSWDAMTRPMMVLTGSRDWGLGGHDVSWRRDSYDHAPAGDKYYVLIEGADHFSCVGRRAIRQTAIMGYIESATLAFWDAYLKNDGDAKAYLKSDALAKASGGAVSVSNR